ncbi:MAG: DinB family protein, partial [Rhodospirillales bacterium]
MYGFGQSPQWPQQDAGSKGAASKPKARRERSAAPDVSDHQPLIGPAPVPGASRREILQTLQRVRRLTEALAEPLAPEDQVVRSIPDTSPTKWHLAHTAWFFETFLLKAFDPPQASSANTIASSCAIN